MKSKSLKKLYPLFYLTIGIVISSFISIKAATTLASSSIYYDTSKSGGSSSNVNGAIDELYSISSDRDELKRQILDMVYPVGSIYISTTDDTVEKTQERFGGTWVKYSSGTTLVGDDGTNYITNDSSKGSGGSSTVTLTTANLPSHSHSFTPAGSVSSKFTGSSVSTSSTNTDHTHYLNAPTSSGGSHTHNLTGPAGHSYGISINEGTTQSNSVNFTIVADRVNRNNYYGRITVDEQGLHSHTISANTGGMSQNSSHSHTVTAKGSVSSSFTGSAGTTGSTGSGTAFSVQNPYTVVYMYKRTA